ncbi:hypothetical protein EMIT079MI2_210001 [Bacillus sp. IT-79MI2]
MYFQIHTMYNLSIRRSNQIKVQVISFFVYLSEAHDTITISSH